MLQLKRNQKRRKTTTSTTHSRPKTKLTHSEWKMTVLRRAYHKKVEILKLWSEANPSRAQFLALSEEILKLVQLPVPSRAHLVEQIMSQLWVSTTKMLKGLKFQTSLQRLVLITETSGVGALVLPLVNSLLILLLLWILLSQVRPRAPTIDPTFLSKQMKNEKVCWTKPWIRRIMLLKNTCKGECLRELRSKNRFRI